jgi:transposase-like protein
LKRHGIGRLPDVEGDKPARRKFKSYPIGFFHIDIAEVQTAEGKLYLFVAIDRTSKFAFVPLVEAANRDTATAFLEALIAPCPTISTPCLPITASSSACRHATPTARTHPINTQYPKIRARNGLGRGLI